MCDERGEPALFAHSKLCAYSAFLMVVSVIGRVVLKCSVYGLECRLFIHTHSSTHTRRTSKQETRHRLNRANGNVSTHNPRWIYSLFIFLFLRSSPFSPSISYYSLPIIHIYILRCLLCFFFFSYSLQHGARFSAIVMGIKTERVPTVLR